MRFILTPRSIPVLFILAMIAVGGCSIKDPDDFNRQGVSLDSQGKIDDAINKYKKALRLEPNNREAHYNLAVAYNKKGLFKEAIEEYKTVILRLTGTHEQLSALNEFIVTEGIKVEVV